MLENARAGRFQDWVAQLLDRRRALLAGPAGDQIEPLDWRPVEPRSERRQSAEVGQLLDLAVGVQGQIAERVEIAVAARRLAFFDELLDFRVETTGLEVSQQ